MNKKERLENARAEHTKFLKSIGYYGAKSVDRSLLDNFQGSYLSIPKGPVANLSNTVGNGFSKSVDDYKWKKGVTESPETIKEIESKKKRIAPIANKTGYQYITPKSDIETLGKKI